MQMIDDFVRFLQNSPTVWHAAKEISNRLAAADFTPLEEQNPWDLKPGQGYFLFREGALCAFRMSTHAPQRVIIAASHTDSPALKLKPQPDIASHGLSQLATEIYGAPLLHTWLDRDLCLAGQIATLSPCGSIDMHLVYLDHLPLSIPSIAPHLERTLSEKGLHIHKQDHLKPIFSLSPTTLASHLSLPNILSFDLFLVPTQPPSYLGPSNELLSAYRIDNLSSAHASLHALLQAKAQPHTLQMAIFWDHEEIGSNSYTGAKSDFLLQTLERLSLHAHLSREDFMRLKARSLCLSIDVAHGLHPNFTEKFDPQNTPHLGQGVAFKFSAEQKYANSAPTTAFLIHLCKTHSIPYQLSASRSDIPSGSTVGSFMAANLGIPTIDIGVPIWAMHSTRETLSPTDQTSLAHLLQAAFQ
ncbi:MAG TPA: M18 family aminopeptidase [Parachlamydiales bacterium]|nr:M18 family aminopeptidase [Parachlamydiales bacterium]